MNTTKLLEGTHDIQISDIGPYPLKKLQRKRGRTRSSFESLRPGYDTDEALILLH